MERFSFPFFNVFDWSKILGACLIALVLGLGAGCKPSEVQNPSASGGGQSEEGSTGTGKMIDKADQEKLPINPKDYKPKPMPEYKESNVKEGPDAEKPVSSPVIPADASKEPETKKSDQ